jgi:hypothetical protein
VLGPSGGFWASMYLVVAARLVKAAAMRFGCCHCSGVWVSHTALYVPGVFQPRAPVCLVLGQACSGWHPTSRGLGSSLGRPSSWYTQVYQKQLMLVVVVVELVVGLYIAGPSWSLSPACPVAFPLHANCRQSTMQLACHALAGGVHCMWRGVHTCMYNQATGTCHGLEACFIWLQKHAAHTQLGCLSHVQCL